MRLPAPLAAAVAAALASAVPAVEIPQRGTDQIAHFCVVAFGGAERWRLVRDMRFTQVVTRYLPGNRPMSERALQVYLRFQPRPQCRIESRTEEGKPHLVVYDGERVRVEVGGREDPDPVVRRRGLRNALSTLYLASLPFPLEDPGVVLSYRGEGKLDGRSVYRLRADVHSSGIPSPADRYEFFIDTETFQVPQIVYTVAAESVSYIVRWSDYRNVDGILRAMRWDYMAGADEKAMSVEFRDLRINPGLSEALFRTRPAAARAPGSGPAQTRPQSAPGPRR